MNKIDYKIFVPRGENNYIKFDEKKEFEIDEIMSINLHIGDDKVVYWLYFKVLEEEHYYKLLLKLLCIILIL